MSDTRTAGNRRWVYPLLFTSLAVNLLIAGIVIGSLASPDRHGGRDFRSVRGYVGEPFVRALPRDERRALFADVVREAPRFREDREQLRARLEGFLDALRSEEFDRSAAEALLQEQQEAMTRRQEVGQQIILDRIDRMSPTERRAYADELERTLTRQRR